MTNDRPPFGGSAAWRVLPIAGLLVWIAAMVVVSVTMGSPSDPSPVIASFVIGGAAYFSLLFAGVAVSMRRAQRRTRNELFERLVVLPLQRGELARAARPMFTIGYVYVAFGAIVTGCGLTLAAVSTETDTDAARPIVTVMLALLVAWALFAFYALARSRQTGAVVVRPLGLTLTEFPRVSLAPFGAGAVLTGAVSYEGTRHGREVAISQTPRAAATAIAGRVSDRPLPRDAIQMAAITGEPATCWRHVEVRRHDDTVLVTRRANGAGAWFLHDLLLAEAVAAV
jgi:hypothetical protein